MLAASEGGGIRGLDALSKHAGGMFVAKERSNLRLRRGPEAMAGYPGNRVGEADRAFQPKCSRL